MQTPLSHDEGIVHREAVDLIHAHGLDLVVMLLISREVSGGAGRGESSRESEDDCSLALEEILGGHVLPLEGVGSRQGRVADASLEDHRRDLVALLERHGEHAHSGVARRGKSRGGEHEGGEDAGA